MYKEKVTAIFAALERAQVTIADLAALTKVSRETLYRWKNGHNVTDRLRLDLVYLTAMKLNNAVDADKLPFVETHKPVERREKLREIIRRMASA